MGLFGSFRPRSSGYHPASILESEFDFQGSIGQGQFGTVWRCESRATKQQFACKQVQKSRFPGSSHGVGDQMRQVTREIEVMQRLQGHANVVDLHSVYENDECIFLLMELCPDGDLFTQISKSHGLAETDARYIFKKVALAVQHCHRNGIIHRDIKPENILLRAPYQLPDSEAVSSAALDNTCGCAPSREWEVKLADFGLSRRIDNGSRLRGCVGSFPYEAPEVVASEPYDWSADVFSLGVLLYTMLAACWPEFKDGRRALNEDVDWSSPCWRLIGDGAKSLIRRMMSVRPCERPTIDEVLCDAWLCDESCVNVLCPAACDAFLERFAQSARGDGTQVVVQSQAVAVNSSPSLSTWLSCSMTSAPSLSSSLSCSSASSAARVPFGCSLSSDSSGSESGNVCDKLPRSGKTAHNAAMAVNGMRSSGICSKGEGEVELNPLAQQDAERRRGGCEQGEGRWMVGSNEHGSSSRCSDSESGDGSDWWQRSKLAAVAVWAVKNVWGTLDEAAAAW